MQIVLGIVLGILGSVTIATAWAISVGESRRLGLMVGAIGAAILFLSVSSFRFPATEESIPILLEGVEETGRRGDFDRENGAPVGEPPDEKRIYKPVYPEEAKRNGIAGSVIARAYIDEKGEVFEVEILEAPSEDFHEPVRAALLKSSFHPATQDGVPIKSQLIVPFDFVLEPE